MAVARGCWWRRRWRAGGSGADEGDRRRAYLEIQSQLAADKTDDGQGAGARDRRAGGADGQGRDGDGRGGGRRREGGRPQGGARRVRQLERCGDCGGEGRRLDRRQRRSSWPTVRWSSSPGCRRRTRSRTPTTARRCRPAASSRRCSSRSARVGGCATVPSLDAPVDASASSHRHATAAHPARQRPRRARPRGSRLSDRRGQPLVSRRLEERDSPAAPASRTCSST